MLLKLKGKVYLTVVRPDMLYGSECWAVKKGQVSRVEVTEVKMLCMMCGVTRKDGIENDCIRGSFGVANIGDKIRGGSLRWYGHLMRKSQEEIAKKVWQDKGQVRRGRGRPKQSWDQVIRKDIEGCGLTRDVAFDRNGWPRMIWMLTPAKVGRRR